MEDLAPPLRCLIEVRSQIEKGSSVNIALRNYLAKTQDEFSVVIEDWLILRSEGRQEVALARLEDHFYRKTLLIIFEKGLSGVPVLEALVEYEKELFLKCDEEIEQKLSDLPFYIMLPVMGLQFPAYLLLLFGPLIQLFMGGLV